MQMIFVSSSVRVLADQVADFFAVDVRQHHVEHDDVGAIFFDHHAGGEAVVGDADFEPAVVLQRVADQFHQILVVIDDERLAACRFPGRRWGCRCLS